MERIFFSDLFPFIFAIRWSQYALLRGPIVSSSLVGVEFSFCLFREGVYYHGR